MESKGKITFFKNVKKSITGLDEYGTFATEKVTKSIVYITKIILIFVIVLSIFMVYKFSIAIGNVRNYIESELKEITFSNNELTIVPNSGKEEIINLDIEDPFNGKIIIDTRDIETEKVDEYTEDIKKYSNGLVILKDKLIFKSSIATLPSMVSYSDLSDTYNINKFDKNDIINILSGNNMLYRIYISSFILVFIYFFIIYFSTVLLDALMYSVIGFIVGIFAKIRLKFSAVYNIAIHALTLPIILNLIYIVVNILTGFTIEYFSIMYMAITCIYIVASILIIKSDLIKRQIELSRIIEEQERVRQELKRKEEQEKEEAEKERLKKEDDKKNKEEKKKEKEKEKNETDGEPQGNNV